jgi:hypothetical protein
VAKFIAYISGNTTVSWHIMRVLFILNLFLFYSSFLFGQTNCFCDKDSLISESVSCDTVTLSNKALLYYQLNCDTVWLTLEIPNKKKTVLFSMGTELAGYNYRLGFQLTKEFKNSLLFRYGCPANGPCNYILVDKSNGRTLRKFDELIYTSEEQQTNIVIYFTDHTFNSLTIFNADTRKSFTVKSPGSRFKYSLRPENQFKSTKVKKDKLILEYRYPENDNEENWKSDTIIVYLKKYAS